MAGSKTTTSTSASTSGEPDTFGHWRKPVSAGLGSLGLIGTAILFVGLVVFVFALHASLLAGVVVAAVLGLVLAPLVIRVGGRSGAQRVTGWVAWEWGRRRRRHLYWSGMTSPVGGGRHRLPGLAAGTRMFECVDAYERPFGLVHTPATRQVSVCFSCAATGEALVDEAQVSAWVRGWDLFLAAMGHEPHLDAVAVTVETAPDTGTRLRGAVAARAVPGSPRFAREVMAEIVDTYPATAAEVSTRVQLTYRMTAPGGVRTVAEMAVAIGTRIPGLAQALARTGAGFVHPMTAADLARVVRVAYDPEAAAAVEADAAADHTTSPAIGPTGGPTGAAVGLGGRGGPGGLGGLAVDPAGFAVGPDTGAGSSGWELAELDPALAGLDPDLDGDLDTAAAAADAAGAAGAGRSGELSGVGSGAVGWENAGPVFAEERRDLYLHDSAATTCWAWSDAPRGVVTARVLLPLLKPHPDIPRKRVTLVYRPHDAGQTAKIVEADVRNARFNALKRSGGVRAADDVTLRAAVQAAKEEARGAGLVRVSMLVTATVTDPTPDSVRQARSTVEGTLGPAAHLGLRRAYGAQSATFAATLPVGVVLAAHSRVPAGFREAA